MFTNFHALINFVHENITICWVVDVNIGTFHLVFEFVERHIRATFVDQMGTTSFVTRHAYEKGMAFVKCQCTKAANQLIIYLENKFPTQYLMDTWGCVP
jgi:hypothetical protein